ncbi:putative MSP domain-containing protein [Phytophthora infestans]|uniref:Putative MSP domain-containing protein n=1 Tax=Phytophthora infestans TaxID=4787 RepID=A0A833W4F7_PHYIN|nr:putative MSP domain-containing protein [Phytophthora infestans]KAF4134462.1 putative MSP domain-containing protein [Phytophthora infestans]
MSKRLKPSEILTAFSTAKAHASKHATSRVIELVNAEDHTLHVSSTVPLHQPLFEAMPAEVWIDEYTPFEPLSIKLRFRNCDTVVRRLRIESPRSPIFRVWPWEARNSKPDRVENGKVAAGMEIAFVLEFFPQEVTDYSLDLVCCTEPRIRHLSGQDVHDSRPNREECGDTRLLFYFSNERALPSDPS